MSITYEQARELVAQRLGEKALAHSVRVSETSALLAALYGVDVDSARIAGVLHDWDRECDAESLMAAATRDGDVLEPAEAGVPYLLHARTGAAALRAEHPEIPDEVLDAVERHTLGAVEMSDLDRIVYVADMIEPGRDYPGVDDLREAAGTVLLDDLFAHAYQHSVAHLVRARKTIHPLTVAVWNRHVARSQR